MTAPMSDDPKILEAGHAATPFTADDIRRGCPTGRTIRLLVEPADEPPFISSTLFVECDSESAVLEMSTTTTDGEEFGPTSTMRATWRELQAHASFPIEVVEIAADTTETPLGTFDCLRYTVDDGYTRDIFCFALDLPGMPVRFTKHIDGRLTSTTTMVENLMPSSS